MMRLRRRTRGCAFCVFLSSTASVVLDEDVRTWPVSPDRVELDESAITVSVPRYSLVHAGEVD